MSCRRYDPVMASAGLIGMSNRLATYGPMRSPASWSVLRRWCWHQRNTLNCSRALLEWQFKLNKQENRHVEGSKGNKEKKKPKGDKNQPKTHVSAYKAAQGEGKPSFNPFARKT